MMVYRADARENGAWPLYTLVFVCTGNTCRSPMAEALARDWLRQHCPKHAARFRVQSAGLAAQSGAPASEGAREAMARLRLSLEEHRARAFTPQMARNATVITMTRAQVALVRKLAPDARVTSLAAWAGIQGDCDVCDPFCGDDTEYCACADQIRSWIDAGFRRMLPKSI